MSYLRPKSMFLESPKQEARVTRSLSSCNNNNNNSDEASDNDLHQLTMSLVSGDMDNVPRLSSKTVRVFISSTFSDMVYERNALMENVYPDLKHFCRESYRLEFQMVDLRWGIREEAHDNHTIIEFCLKETENCRKISIGPSFVILLGQKYGYRPFPPTISAKEFEAIQEELIASAASSSSSATFSSSSLSPSDITLLSDWFKKDTNILNNEYVLQPISSLIPDYGNEEDEDKRKTSETEWERTRLKLLELLRKGVSLCVEQNKLPLICKDKYFVSMTEYEIERGLFVDENASDSCLCFIRTIDNLENNPQNPKTRPYLDFVSPNCDLIDKDAQNLLKDLQNVKIPQHLPDERNLEYLKLKWTDKDDRDPVDNDEYLNEFCEAFREKMQWLINKSAKNISKINSIPRMVEIIQQLHMCKTRSEGLRGREGTLKKIRQYLVSTTSTSSTLPSMVPHSSKPLVLYGESGCGKTSVCAKAAHDARQWFKQNNDSLPIVVFRFLGTTCYSCSIRLVLGSICWQIAMAYGLSTSDIPSDYPGLVFFFHEVIKKSSRTKPLVLILDGLDQLGPAHRAHSLAWMPCHLPEHVKLVVSTVPNKFDILATLQNQLTLMDKQNFVEIHPLGTQLSFNLIKEWLRSSHMDLTTSQFDIVCQALLNCSLPLYTKLVFEEIKRWRSYYSEDQTVLEPSVEKIICSLLDRIELSHGQLFVSYTLSYLTASREGLSDVELEDILSLDDDVLDDVFQHWLPPLRRVPPLLVPRLYSELSSYVIQRETNGTMVFYWYHAQFIEVARERYLSNETHRSYIHQILAHYFLGTWGGGKKKPFVCSDKQLKWIRSKSLDELEDRKVPTQPLIFGQTDNPVSIGNDLILGEKPNYNLRKLCELPFHLLESKMYWDLKFSVFFNYEWLYTKISALSLHDVLSDFTLAFQSWKTSDDVLLLSSALRMSGSQINKNPCSLAFDLIGRLLHCYSDNDKHFSIRQLLQQCDQMSIKHSALVPLQQCFELPSSMILFVMEGHNQVVSDLIINENTNELVSVSKDGYLAFWDLVSGERSRTIDVSAFNPGRLTRLFQSADEKYLVVDSDANESAAVVFDTKTGQLLRQFGSRELTQRRGFVSGNVFCRQKNIFDLVSGKEIKQIKDFADSKSYVTCTITPDGKFILVGEQKQVKMYNLKTGALMKSFDNEDDNDISALRCTSDSSFCYCGYAGSCLVTYIDINPNSWTFGKQIQKIRCQNFTRKFPLSHGSCHDYKYIQEIAEISLCFTNQSRVLIDVCSCQLICFDAKTQRAVLMKSVSSSRYGQQTSSNSAPMFISKSSLNYDGRLALASSENYLHIWDSVVGDHLQTITIHSTSDFPFPWTISKTRNIVATGSTINTAVRVWDLDKSEETEAPPLKVYKNPVDCVACAPTTRLVYVKSYYGLNSSSKGYKFFDRFAIDVWNVSTGNWKNFLPFNRYGRLQEMKCSHNGNYISLLLSSLSQWYVVIVDVHKDKVLCAAGHDVDWQCKEFELSPDWEYMATYATLDFEEEVILWSVKKNKKIVCFHEAKCPLFTLDGQYLLYIDTGVNIILYSLTNCAPAKCQLQIFPDRLTCLPVKHHSILVTSFKGTHSTVSVWDFHGSGRIKVEISNVSLSGFVDVSKNGAVAVDDLLQVFALNSGAQVASFQRQNEPSSDKEMKRMKLVKLTYDGLYCIWSDENICSVKVGCISSGSLIAQASVHEKLVTMEVMDYGYVIFGGREDGHIITMKLTAAAAAATTSEAGKASSKGQPLYLTKNEVDRRNYILDQDSCSRSVVSQFDSDCQELSQYLADSEMKTNCPNIASQISKHAELPRIFTFLKGSAKNSTAGSSTAPSTPSVLQFAQKNSFFQNHSSSCESRPFQKAKRFLEGGNQSSGGQNANSLPRRYVHSKPDIQIVDSSNPSLASHSNSSDEESPVSPTPAIQRVQFDGKRSRSAQELNKLNKNPSKSSLESLISDSERISRTAESESVKTRGTNVLGRHSLKLSADKQKKRHKFLAIFASNRANK